CHGSPAVVAALIDALREAGARMARPGEFTERAFLNGRIDLAQAEGVANLIASRTRAAGRAALSQLRGALSNAVRAIREILTDLAAEIEARLDFPEEEIDAEGAEEERRFRQAGLESFAQVLRRLGALIATARRGRLFRDGARVVIAGKPNTGKSSLFNGLVGRERALVTPHPGTTRDTIEATLDMRGIPIVLIDTAGVRQDSHDEIETLGIERAKGEVASADLVVLVIDGSSPVDSEDARLFQSLAETPKIVAANKSDLPAAQDDAALIQALTDAGGIETERGAPGNVEQPPSAVSGEGEGEKTRERRLKSEPETPLLRVCALRPAALGPLEASLADALLGEEGAAAASDGATVTNLRHEELLRRTLDALGRARRSFAESASGEFTMIDLRDALDSLGEIIGETVDDAILSRIFSKFCVGK
ncbi:MAG TPA: tRNA modification GTPase, partial [Sumerlaeia bacterium]|nr:tRNA modification GTPase [Sumerlaeia bacterium]